jgi:hypothetical protein
MELDGRRRRRRPDIAQRARAVDDYRAAVPDRRYPGQPHEARLDAATPGGGAGPAQVSAASVAGAELGSSELSFTPGPIKGGDYHLAIAVVAIDFERGARRNTCVMKSTCQPR